MLKVFVVLACAATLAGCAATYQQPSVLAQNASGPLKGAKPETMNAARRALVSAGYQITASDESSGTISTAPRNLHLTPKQADCGKTLGLDYLLDNRTATRVAIGVIVDQSTITVQSNIEGEYRPGAVDQDITLTCVSRGTLESEMLSRIQSYIP